MPPKKQQAKPSNSKQQQASSSSSATTLRLLQNTNNTWHHEKLESILNTTIERALQKLATQINDIVNDQLNPEDEEIQDRTQIALVRLDQRLERFQTLWKRNLKTLLLAKYQEEAHNNNSSDKGTSRSTNTKTASAMPRTNTNVNKTSSFSSSSIPFKYQEDEEQTFASWTQSDPQLRILMNQVRANIENSRILKYLGVPGDHGRGGGGGAATATTEARDKKFLEGLKAYPRDLYFNDDDNDQEQQQEKNNTNGQSATTKSQEDNNSNNTNNDDIHFVQEWIELEDDATRRGEPFNINGHGRIEWRYFLDDNDKKKNQNQEEKQEEDNDEDNNFDDYFMMPEMEKVDAWLNEFHQRHFGQDGDKKKKIIHLNGISWGIGNTAPLLHASPATNYSTSNSNNTTSSTSGLGKSDSIKIFRAGHCFVKFPSSLQSNNTDNNGGTMMSDEKSNLENAKFDEEIFARFDLVFPKLQGHDYN